MAGFLRKKSTPNVGKNKPDIKASPMPTPAPVSSSAPSVPPLYARFATSHQSSPNSPRIVSGPMALAPKDQFMPQNNSRTAVNRVSQATPRVPASRPRSPPSNKPPVPERTSWYKKAVESPEPEPQPATTPRHQAYSRGHPHPKTLHTTAKASASHARKGSVDKPLPSPDIRTEHAHVAHRAAARTPPPPPRGSSLDAPAPRERHVLQKHPKNRTSVYDASSAPQTPTSPPSRGAQIMHLNKVASPPPNNDHYPRDNNTSRRMSVYDGPNEQSMRMSVSPRSPQSTRMNATRPPTTLNDHQLRETPPKHRLAHDPPSPQHHVHMNYTSASPFHRDERTLPSASPKASVIPTPTSPPPNRRASAAYTPSLRNDKPLPVPIPSSTPSPTPPIAYSSYTESRPPSRQSRNTSATVQTPIIARQDNRRASTSFASPRSPQTEMQLPSPDSYAGVPRSAPSRGILKSSVAGNRTTLIASSYVDPSPVMRSAVPDRLPEGSPMSRANVDSARRDSIASNGMAPLSPRSPPTTFGNLQKTFTAPTIAPASVQIPGSRRTSITQIEMLYNRDQQEGHHVNESGFLPSPSTSPKPVQGRQVPKTDVVSEMTAMPEQRRASSSHAFELDADLPEKEIAATYKRRPLPDPAPSRVVSPPQAQDTDMQLRAQTHAATQHNPHMPSLRLVGAAASPVRGKPRIFAAMTAEIGESYGAEEAEQFKSELRPDVKVDTRRSHAIDAYPSPPMESGPSPRVENVATSPEVAMTNIGRDMITDWDELEARASGIALGPTPPQSPPRQFTSRTNSHKAPQRSTTPSKESSSALQESPSRERGVSAADVLDPESVVSARPSNRRRKSSSKSTASERERSQIISYAGSTSSAMANVTATSSSNPATVSSWLIPPSASDNAESSSLLDDDPFARVEGVRMLPPSRDASPSSRRTSRRISRSSRSTDSDRKSREIRSRTPSLETQAAPSTPPKAQQPEASMPSPESPEDYRQARSRRRGAGLEKEAPEFAAGLPVREDRPPQPFLLAEFLAEPALLSTLLEYMSFGDWCLLGAVSKQIRGVVLESPALREVVLERYLGTVGYARWSSPGPDPLPLSIKDLHDYMRGVSIPTHEYARASALCIQARLNRAMEGYDEVMEMSRSMAAATRAYTRVVLRLRAQAEATEAERRSRRTPSPGGQPSAWSPHRGYTGTSMSSRAPSPSSMSHASLSQVNLALRPSTTNSTSQGAQEERGRSMTFRSPLFRPRRAPLLRVFVPSADEWLSDDGIVESEEELRKAGVLGLLRLGDVVWDVAVGDEGNVGRLVWDGSYIIDLDYTYSAVGDLPKYLHTFAFPPSYFHRVIRTGATSSNPVAHIDVSPWGEEIAANLQLLQDRVRTETPQGNYHNVVRWVHRSSFTIRPPARTPPRSRSIYMQGNHNRIPLPGADGQFVDPSWYGTVIVETEGTNEALADLQERCGPGAFPPRAKGVAEKYTDSLEREREGRKVWRILRERSRPSEIWIRAVSAKERLL
ncbi:hypothetical protein HGRIS_014318 [Hohenbuehelia grisea]|uniref:F-box domain-containing protein n=1 Tax=Hohenbuehelia grisea TaxID=104357 RepID=A0ABR3JUZ4_9AGAR